MKIREGKLILKNVQVKKIKPLLTIITVVFNCVNEIEKTIKSVLSFKNDQIEYIVIDGNSNDGTTNIINNYKNKVDRIICEPDSGIYNAMNKGASYATGEFLFWLNAGDILIKQPMIFESVDCILTNVLIKFPDSNLSKVFVSKEYSSLECKDLIHSKYHHQGFFIKKKIFDQVLFDEEVGIRADTLCMYQSMKRSNQVKYIPDCFVAFELLGASDQDNINKFISLLKILNKSGCCSLVLFLTNIIEFSKIILKIILPQKLKHELKMFKWSIEKYKGKK